MHHSVYIAGLQLRVCNQIPDFSTKTYVVGTQKKHLNETFLLSTKTYVKSDGLENIDNFTLKNCVYLNP